MFGSIKGHIILKTEKFVVVEALGVGYRVNVSPDTLAKIAPQLHSEQNEKGEIVSFWIHTHVREDILDLYGFLEYSELEFFEMLISVSGIGPRGALSILSVASTNTLKRAIGTGDIGYLTKISGIGKKTAEKMVIELRDKLGKEHEGGSLKEELDTLEALRSLGYSQNEARVALKKIDHTLPTNTKIREALKLLGGR